MDYEMIMLYGTIGVGAALAAYKVYKKVMADGKISLDEVLDVVDDLQDIADDLPSLSELKKMKKAELVALCEKHGLDANGLKADLIEQLKTINISKE